MTSFLREKSVIVSIPDRMIGEIHLTDTQYCHHCLQPIELGQIASFSVKDEYIPDEQGLFHITTRLHAYHTDICWVLSREKLIESVNQRVLPSPEEHPNLVGMLLTHQDIESLRIQALDTTNTSYVFEMPLSLSNILPVHPDTWTKENCYGLFQHILIFDVPMDNIKTVLPLQHKKIGTIIQKAYSPGLENIAYAYILPSEDDITTTWRVVLLTQLDEKTYQDKIWNFFELHFLHPDAEHPNIMSWSQALNEGGILPNPLAIEEIPGLATHSIEAMKKSWISRMNACKTSIREFQDKLVKKQIPSISNGIPCIAKEYDVNTTYSNSSVFSYYVNSQICNEGQLVYTFHKQDGLKAWQALQDTNCPVLYTHQQDMLTSFELYKLDRLVKIYPPIQ